jgi:hypothetical protein
MKTLFVTILLGCMTGLGLLAQMPKFEWVNRIDVDINLNIQGIALAVDASGNSYVTGPLNSIQKTDFDPGSDSCILDWRKGARFIAKYDVRGSFVWARNMAGYPTGSKHEQSIAVDAKGNVYSIGCFRSFGDFDPGPSVVELTPVGKGAGGTDIFLMKLDTDGNFKWAKQFGGYGFDEARSVVIDPRGNVVITGMIGADRDSIDLDPGVNEHKVKVDSQILFIEKLDPEGNYLWTKQLADNQNTDVSSMTIDYLGNIYTTGYFSDNKGNTSDFDPGEGVHPMVDLNGSIFILKLDSTGQFIWGRQVGSRFGRGGSGSLIQVDSRESVYVIGNIGDIGDTCDFDPGDGTHYLVDTSRGSGTDFILKLDKEGKFLFANQLTGSTSMKVDSDDNYYTTSSSSIWSDGLADITCNKNNAKGNVEWSAHIKGKENQKGLGYFFRLRGNAVHSLRLDNIGNVYVLGRYEDTCNFNPSDAGSFTLTGAGLFLLKLSQQPTSAEEHITPHTFSIYPNPGTTTITAAFGKEVRSATVRINDLLGQVLVSQADVSGNSLQVDVSQFSSGMYVLELSDGGIVSRVKLVKE